MTVFDIDDLFVKGKFNHVRSVLRRESIGISLVYGRAHETDDWLLFPEESKSRSLRDAYKLTKEDKDAKDWVLIKNY